MKIYYFIVQSDESYTKAFRNKAKAVAARNEAIREHYDDRGAQVFDLAEVELPISADGMVAAFQYGADTNPQ